MSKRKSDGWVSQRRDGRWNVGYGGKRTVRPTRAVALECLREMRAKGDKERTVPVNGTLSGYARVWLKDIFSVGVKPTTTTHYEACLRILLSQECGNKGLALGDMQMRSVKAENVRSALRSMTKDGRNAMQGRQALRLLSQCCEYYIAEGLLGKNPCTNVVAPETKNRRLITDNLAYDGNEMRAIISEAMRKKADGNYVHRFWYVYLLLANTGMRVGELLCLKWENVDFAAHTITIEGNRVRVRDLDTGSFVCVEQDTAKTASSTRVIPINATALRVLKEVAESRGTTTGHVVLTDKGAPTDANSIDTGFYRLLRHCGVEKKKRHGVHSLRHTFATRLIEQGAPIKIVSELLGHSSVAITLNVYVHHNPEEMVSAVELLDGR